MRVAAKGLLMKKSLGYVSDTFHIGKLEWLKTKMSKRFFALCEPIDKNDEAFKSLLELTLFETSASHFLRVLGEGTVATKQ